MAKIVAPPVEEILKNYDIDPELASDSAAQTAAASTDDAGEKLGLSTEQKEAIAAEVVQIDAALERLTERREQLKQIIRDNAATLTDGGYGTVALHSEAGIKVTVGHNSRLNKDRFMESYPYDFSKLEDQIVEDKKGRKMVQAVEVFPNRKFYKIDVDTAAIKKNLDEQPVIDEETGALVADGWRRYYDEGDASITFR